MEPSIGIFRSHSQIGNRIHRILTSPHLNIFISPKLRKISLILSLSIFLLTGWIYAGAQKGQGKLQQKGEPATIEGLIHEEIPRRNLSPEEIFKQAELKRSQIESIEMEYEVEDKKQKSIIEIIWQKPNLTKFVWSINDQHQIVNIFDGKIQRHGHLSGIMKVDLSRATQLQWDKIREDPDRFYACCWNNNAIAKMRISPWWPVLCPPLDPTDWNFQAVETTALGEAYFLTRGEIKGKTNLWIGCNDGLIYKQDLFLKGHKIGSTVLKKVKINQPIPQERFIYQPSSDVKVKEIAVEEFIKQIGAVEKGRQNAYLHACMANMKQILLGIQMYTQDYSKYPDKLSDLYPDYIMDLKLFTCPATRDKITMINKEVHPFSLLIEIDTKSSYEYRGVGLTRELAKKDPQKIILIEKECNHTTDGKPVRCVGYADGHVEAKIVEGSSKAKIHEQLEKKVSVTFSNAHIKDVLKYLSKTNAVNIILDERALSDIDPRVITVSLKDIPLIDALVITLKSKGLEYKIKENYIWVSTPKRIKEMDKVVTKPYALNYSPPQKMRELLEKALQPDEKRKIVCDEKTSTLIITDSLSNHEQIKGLIAKFDQSEPQFHIKITHIRTKESGEAVVNRPRIITGLNIPASVDIGDRDSTLFFHYEVLPSLTEEGMISLEISYEAKEGEGGITQGRTRVILNDGETKEVFGIGGKEKFKVSVERLNPKKPITVIGEKISYLKDKNEIVAEGEEVKIKFPKSND